MASIDYVFKVAEYESGTVNLTATVHLPQNTSSIKGIGQRNSQSKQSETFSTNSILQHCISTAAATLLEVGQCFRARL